MNRWRAYSSSVQSSTPTGKSHNNSPGRRPGSAPMESLRRTNAIVGNIQNERKRYNRSFKLISIFYRQVMPLTGTLPKSLDVVPGKRCDQRKMIGGDL